MSKKSLTFFVLLSLALLFTPTHSQCDQIIDVSGTDFQVCITSAQVIDECELYDTEDSITQNLQDGSALTFTCFRCNSGFFLATVSGETADQCLDVDDFVVNCPAFESDRTTCNCSAGSFTEQVELLNGTIACADLEDYVSNCEGYAITDETPATFSVECALCPDGYDLVPLASGFACGFNLPNCQIFDVDINDVLIFSDINGNDAVLCDTCESGFDSFNEYFDHPLLSNTQGQGCPADGAFPNCHTLTFSVMDLQYQCTECASDYKLIDLDTGSTACVDQDDISLIDDCVLYNVTTSPDFTCVECGTRNLAAFENNDGDTATICLVPGRDQGNKCLTYRFLTPTQALEYCIECAQGYNNFPVRSGNTAGLCSEQELIEGCVDYSGSSPDDEQPECEGCDPNIVNATLPFCTDGSGSCAAGQIEVDVAESQECANSGFVSFCASYESVSDLALGNCAECDEGYVLNTASSAEPICVLEITGCTEYNPEDLLQCEACLLNIPVEDNACRTADEIIDRCDNVTVENDIIKCTTCKSGFALDFESNLCVPQNAFCAQYFTNGICRDCIPNYLLVNGLCLSIPTNCDEVDENTALCLDCAEGFDLSNGLCIGEDSTDANGCTSTQYLNTAGICVEGTVKNCAQYNSFGVCLACETNFSFTLDLTKCVFDAEENVQCPPDTATVRYEINNGDCIPIDSNCAEDGFRPLSGCFRCQEGFYLSNRRCFPIMFVN